MNQAITVGALVDGSTFVLDHVRERDVQAIEIRVKAGFDQDPADRPGVAHLVEHLALRRAAGTKSHLAAVANFEALGLRPQAVTARSFTSFSVLAPSQHAVEALDELRRMVSRPEFTDAAVRDELRIISAERETHAAEPLRTLMEVAESGMFGHTTGTVNESRSLTECDARAFWERHYRPANIVISTSGPVKDLNIEFMESNAAPAATRAAVEPRSAAQSASADSESIHISRRDSRTAQVHLLVSFPVSAVSLRDRAIANVLASVLGVGFSSFLVRKLRIEQQLCYSPRAFFTRHGALGSVTAVASVVERAERGASTILSNAMQDLSADPLLAHNVDVAKSHLRSGTILAFDDLAKRASGLASAWLSGHGLENRDVIASIDDVRTEEVQNLATRLALLPQREVVMGDPIKP